MGEGYGCLSRNTSRGSLRLLGTVGEPINPEAWEWYTTWWATVRCPIVDTWWQTETGGILISPLPGATRNQAGFGHASPLFGVQPAIVDGNGQALEGEAIGNLVLAQRQLAGPDAHRLGRPSNASSTPIFSQYPGRYFSGDGCPPRRRWPITGSPAVWTM